MLNNPTKIVVHTEKDGNKFVGSVYAYGYDTESVNGMMKYLSSRPTVTTVEIDNG
jgi:hypothetical protein